jgi:hypothetical protein
LSNPFTLLLLLALALAVYFTPRWIASGRKHPNAKAIFVALLKPGSLMFLWLLVVGAFAGYGVLLAGLNGPLYAEPFFNIFTLDSVLFYGGIGFTVATCLTASLHAVRRLQEKSITFDTAVSFSGLCSAIAAFVPPLAIALSGHWHGEETLGILYLAVFTVGAGIVGFGAFGAWIVLRRRTDVAELKERCHKLSTAELIHRMSSGALDAGAAIALREVVMERSDSAKRATIYVALENEGIDVWRPVEASILGDNLFQILTFNDPKAEQWQFASGAVVRCAKRDFADGQSGLAAMELAYVPAA